jgi:hypothetical protein
MVRERRASTLGEMDGVIMCSCVSSKAAANVDYRELSRKRSSVWDKEKVNNNNKAKRGCSAPSSHKGIFHTNGREQRRRDSQ